MQDLHRKQRSPWQADFALVVFVLTVFNQGCDGQSKELAQGSRPATSETNEFVEISGYTDLTIEGERHRWQLTYDFDQATWHQIEYLPEESVDRYTFEYRSNTREERLLVSTFRPDSVALRQFSLQDRLGDTKAWVNDGLQRVLLKSKNTIEFDCSQGFLHGPIQISRPDGSIGLQGEFCKGTQCGRWTSFGSNGEVAWRGDIQDHAGAVSLEHSLSVHRGLRVWVDDMRALLNFSQ